MQEEASGTPEKGTGSELTDEKGKKTEDLFDLVIPPGTPQSVILDVIKKFDVEIADRKERLYFANMDGDERILLAFRGKLEVMKELEPYFYAKVKEFIESA